MTTTIEEILGPDVLTEAIQMPAEGVPKLWPEKFYSTTKQISGNTAKWIQTASTRKNARATNYGSPSKKRELRGGTPMASQCINFGEHVVFEPYILEAIGRMSDDEKQAKIIREYVAGQIEDFQLLFDNSRASAISSMFRHRKIYLGSDGDILYTSSGAAQTIDLGYNANYFAQLNGIISASWATAGTSILKQLQAWELAAMKSGEPLEYMYYGTDVLGFILGNTEIKELMKSDSALTSSLRQGKIPDGFGFQNSSIKWRSAANAFFVDQNGTSRDWIDANMVVGTPDANLSWYELQEGSSPVPTSLDLSGDGDPFADIESVHGKYSYVTKTTDPIGVKMVVGDLFLPVPKVSTAIYTATVSGF